MTLHKQISTLGGVIVRDLTPEEEAIRLAEETIWENEAPTRAWAALRGERDTKLRETDWWALSDLNITVEQTVYRQALRDLPATTDDPYNPIWPTLPE